MILEEYSPSICINFLPKITVIFAGLTWSPLKVKPIICDDLRNLRAISSATYLNRVFRQD